MSKMPLIRKLNYAVILGSLLVSGTAMSATINGSLNVTAVVNTGCDITTAGSGIANFGDLDFGNILPMNEMHVDAETSGVSGNIAVECTSGVSYTIALDNGQNYTGSSRAMKHASASDVLRYELYQDPARSTPWDAVSTLTGVGDGNQHSHKVYGRIPGGQTAVAAGSYSDLVQVTVNW